MSFRSCKFTGVDYLKEMSPNKRIQKKMPLVLECEWGSCQDTFGRMENLCKHMETHLGTSDPSEDSDENEGQGNDRSMDETHCETFTWSQ